MSDERFKPGRLEQMLARAEARPAVSIQQPEISLADVLVRLRLAESVVQRKTSEEADREIEALARQLVLALATSPSDAFLWLMLYSVDVSRSGFSSKTLTYLKQSYLAAPREAWIALRRNRLGLAVFPMLEEPVRNNVVSEFAGLLDSGFPEEAAANLVSTGWPHRKILLASLEPVDFANRQTLSKLLAAQGLKLEVPGIQPSDRPW